MNSEIRSGVFAADEHPDENQLLLALERELSAEEVSQLERHLGNCWSCRARSEEMQRGILAFVEYREKRYLPSLKTPPTDYRGFEGRLRSVAVEGGRIGLLAKIWRRIIALFAFPGQVKWVSVVATSMALVIFWAEVLNPPAISANELLTRAVAAQNPPASIEKGAPLRVAHQKVKIRIGSQTIVRDFAWTLGRPIQHVQWNTQSNLLEWNAPLSAEGFSLWRDSLQERSDRVKRSGDLLRLDTRAAHSFIREAWMVVRANDFHPVEQHMQFADDRQLDLTELAFEIRDQPQPVVQSSTVTRPPSTSVDKPKTAALPSQAELDETEFQLRYILFTHQWDLGEDLSIGRDSGKVTLSGKVSSAERERAMQATLSTLPHVQLSLDIPGVVKGAPHGISAPGQTLSAAPLLKDTLERTFTSRQERLAFVDRCLAASDTALTHAWALKRLADRYNEAQENALNPESARKLHEMLRTHLAQLSRANAELQALVDVLPGSAFKAPETAPLNWRSGMLALFTKVQQQDDRVASLVVGTGMNGLDLGTASLEFQSAHLEIDTLLGSLEHQAY